MDKFIVNLSDRTFTEDQNSVLSKGLNFCPSPLEPNSGAVFSNGRTPRNWRRSGTTFFMPKMQFSNGRTPVPPQKVA
jgi:hypothetical protein